MQPNSNGGPVLASVVHSSRPGYDTLSDVPEGSGAETVTTQQTEVTNLSAYNDALDEVRAPVATLSVSIDANVSGTPVCLGIACVLPRISASLG